MLALAAALFALPARAEDHTLPNPRITPGAVNPAVTQASIATTICRKGGYTKSIRPPAAFTNRLKRQQLASYGYSDRNPRDYEEDHLESLEIGGAPRDPKNLWPEPRKGAWNSLMKDALENELHKLVCSKKITLAEAQAAIRVNWTVAYRQYVHVKPKRRR